MDAYAKFVECPECGEPVLLERYGMATGRVWWEGWCYKCLKKIIMREEEPEAEHEDTAG